MNTLIIPCAGRSSRFPNVRPKWMLYYPDGKMMVEKAIDGLDLGKYDKVIITITKHHCEDYNADRVLNDAFHFDSNQKYKLCILDDYTASQSETIYLTIRKEKITGRFAVKDSDNYIVADPADAANFVVGLHIPTFQKNISRLQQKSFLRLNEQKNINDIIEKKIVSDEICIGMYGFESTELFNKAYEHLSRINTSGYEIYLSHIISYLISTKQAIYQCVEASDYEDWGTLQDWYKLLDQRRTYVINIDGVLYEPCEAYGEKSWRRGLVPIEKNFEKVKEFSDAGAQIILFSSMPQEFDLDILDDMNKYDIHVYQLVMGCYASHTTFIQKFDDNIPYPACEAVNILKEGNLKDYIHEK